MPQQFELKIDNSATESVSVVSQNGSLTEGMAGQAEYVVTTTNIAGGSSISLEGAVPTGVEIDNATNTTTNNITTIKVNTTVATPKGTYTLTLKIDEIESSEFDLIISEKPSFVLDFSAVANGTVTAKYTGGASIISGESITSGYKPVEVIIPVSIFLTC